MKKSAIVIAAAVYHLAMRDELLPRFTKEDMPAAPVAPAGGRSSRVRGSRVRGFADPPSPRLRRGRPAD